MCVLGWGGGGLPVRCQGRGVPSYYGEGVSQASYAGEGVLLTIPEIFELLENE